MFLGPLEKFIHALTSKVVKNPFLFQPKKLPNHRTFLALRTYFLFFVPESTKNAQNLIYHKVSVNGFWRMEMDIWQIFAIGTITLKAHTHTRFRN